MLAQVLSVKADTGDVKINIGGIEYIAVVSKAYRDSKNISRLTGDIEIGANFDFAAEISADSKLRASASAKSTRYAAFRTADKHIIPVRSIRASAHASAADMSVYADLF